jgi:GH24 family phage-related lysozyme (muramidase)
MKTQNQFDATLDLIYNIGPGNFRKDKDLILALSEGNADLITGAFNAHVYDSKGNKLSWLVKRRADELKLFFS